MKGDAGVLGTELLCATQIRKEFAPKSVAERLWIIGTGRTRRSALEATWSNLSQPLRAVDRVDLSVDQAEIVGLVGESGSGKTTLARTLACLTPASGGSIVFEGEEISSLSRREMRPKRTRLRMMSQSPSASLNPHLTVKDALIEAVGSQLHLPRPERLSKARELLEMVQLGPEVLGSLPSELSGGQQRRVAIARALVGNPSLIIMDEPVAALDTSIQAQIVRLIQELNARERAAFLVISHNLAMVRYIATRLVVMYQGRVVEEGGSADLASRASHPYTVDLMRSATYELGCLTARQQVVHTVSSVGCAYRETCMTYCDLDSATRTRCESLEPSLFALDVSEGAGHRVACHAADTSG